jgi:protein-S-isoprenylcysteine O-methyltransferase Ste14
MSVPGKGHGEPLQVTFRLIVRIVLRWAIVLGALGALLFLPAGRLDWTEAWLFVALYGFFLMGYALWGLFRDPGQLLERGRAGPNAKAWDKTILRVYTALVVVLFVLVSLDAGRFRWSSTPSWLRIPAWLGLFVAGGIIFWALAVNTYLSRVVRIQRDRGHRVVAGGPYRYLRHPMYAGIVLMFLCIPVALGSLWGLIPGGMIGALYVVRTALEDRTLQEELEGYREYAQRVRYRLLPGIW